MNADDRRHGTHAGYQAHRAEDSAACEPCLAANTRYHKGLLLDHYGGRPRKVPALGTRRRLQALMRLGWSMRKIAAHSGSSTTVICWILDESHDTILRSTAETFTKTYDALSMQLPTGGGVTRAQRSAERKGYAPPLAYEEGRMDDPTHTPAGHVGGETRLPTPNDVDLAVVMRVLEGEQLSTTKAERHEIVRRWVAGGGSEAEICRRMNWRQGRYNSADRTERKAS